MAITRKELKELGRKYYYNPQEFSTTEFEDDLKILGYVKRQIKLSDEEINYHLILNHIITLNNVFGPEGTVVLLREVCEEEYYSSLNSFFFHLSIIPRGERNVNLDVRALFWLTNIFENSKYE